MGSIGHKIQPILEEIENTLWDYEARLLGKADYPEASLRSASKVMMSVIMDKMWEIQVNENMPQKDRENMALRCGEDFRKLIKTYTNLDTHDFYNKPA